MRKTLVLALTVLVLLPMAAHAAGAWDELWWEWLVRWLVQECGGWWQGC